MGIRQQAGTIGDVSRQLSRGHRRLGRRQPDSKLVQVAVPERQSFRRRGQACIDHRPLVAQLGHRAVPEVRRPGFNTRSAPTGIHQPDRHVQLQMQASPEVIRHRRKAPRGSRATDLPRPFRVRAGQKGRDPRNRHKPYGGIVGCGNLRRRVRRPLNGPLHVGLAGTEPYLADHHVLNCNTVHGERLAHRVGRHGGQRHQPVPIRVGRCGDDLSVKRHRHRFTGVRPTPYLDRHIPLQDHVVVEEPGQPHLRFCRKAGHRKQQSDRRGAIPVCRSCPVHIDSLFCLSCGIAPAWRWQLSRGQRAKPSRGIPPRREPPTECECTYEPGY